jgi:XTP/dITP diphosphohydrolase
MILIFPMKMKIVLATHNRDKCAEMEAIMKDMPIQLLTLNEFPEIEEIIEDGQTLEENALIKAKTVHKITHLPAIADDTGLEVDALGGQPGIYSARYAGENCSYSDNVNKLLKEMANIPLKKRAALFKTAIAYVDENMELTTDGVVEGVIIDVMKGIDGFGYDPVFYMPGMKKTYAEMSMNEKNQISHRGKAVKNMQILLQSRLPQIFQQMEDIA